MFVVHDQVVINNVQLSFRLIDDGDDDDDDDDEPFKFVGLGFRTVTHIGSLITSNEIMIHQLMMVNRYWCC